MVTKTNIPQAGGTAMRPWIALSAQTLAFGATAGAAAQVGSARENGVATGRAVDAAPRAVVTPALGGPAV